MEHTQLCRLSHCLERIPEVARWCLALAGERIVAGLGVIENDFHPRTDLAPNVCAVYTGPDCRGRGLAGQLLGLACAELAAEGITTLYLLTDHTGFYERYGWEFFCTVRQEGEPQPTRVYRHQAAPTGKQE